MPSYCAPNSLLPRVKTCFPLPKERTRRNNCILVRSGELMVAHKVCDAADKIFTAPVYLARRGTPLKPRRINRLFSNIVAYHHQLLVGLVIQRRNTRFFEKNPFHHKWSCCHTLLLISLVIYTQIKSHQRHWVFLEPGNRYTASVD